jgi:hypothetical protein
MSCFCGQTHTSLSTALACWDRAGASQSAPAGKNTLMPGGRSVSPRQDSASRGVFRGTSRLMGRRLGSIGELGRDRGHERGEGLLWTSRRGGRPALSPDERRRRGRERKRLWRAGQ